MRNGNQDRLIYHMDSSFEFLSCISSFKKQTIGWVHDLPYPKPYLDALICCIIVLLVQFLLGLSSQRKAFNSCLRYYWIYIMDTEKRHNFQKHDSKKIKKFNVSGSITWTWTKKSNRYEDASMDRIYNKVGSKLRKVNISSYKHYKDR